MGKFQQTLKVMGPVLLVFFLVMTANRKARAETEFPTASEGLARIKANLENSKRNLNDYIKNLSVVKNNVNEVAKAKGQVEEQQKQVQQQTNENTKSLSLIATHEKELSHLISQEKSKEALENQKILEYEAIIAKIKENQKKREKNIEEYQLQMNQTQDEKKIWLDRAANLKSQIDQVTQHLKSLNNEEKEWRGKQQGYEGEVKRWSGEVERQQKLNDSYSSLAEVK